MWPIIVIVAQLTAAQVDAAKAAYQKLAPADIEAHKAAGVPPKDAQRIDVSPRMKSASFGHKTFLLVAPDGRELWVEYGPSTNKPGGLYGPFPVGGAAAAPGAAPTK
jgi:hypothetical protein